MRIAQIQREKLTEIFDKLRVFNYTTIVDGENITVNAELYPTSETDFIVRYFVQKYGTLKISELLADYNDGAFSADDLSNLTKRLCSQKWAHFLEMWKSVYNPLYNVDGTESKTITTEYGRITTYAKGETETNAHTVDGSETYTDRTTLNEVSAFNSASLVENTRDTVTPSAKTYNDGTRTTTHGGENTDTNSGTDTTTESTRRYGNIGVTMTQQLLTAEKNFWSNFDFFTMFFDTVVPILTYPIFETE